MSERRDFDVVIVGSGVAGALVGFRLARAGAKVLVLEAGERGAPLAELVGTYASALAKTPHAPYVSAAGDRLVPSPDSERDYDQAADDPSPDRVPFKSGYERRVGGTTWHWLGHTPRLLPNDFRLRTRYGVGVDWPIGYADLEPWYCEAERELGVAGDDEEFDGLLGAFRSRPFPLGKVWPSYSDLEIAARITGLEFEGVRIRVTSMPSARNTEPYDGRPVCSGNSICVPLCPIGAKYDATVHVRKGVVDHGMELRDRSVVTRLEADADGLVRRVVYRTWDGVEQVVRGRVVVVAANAVESPRLLLMSATDARPGGLANRSDQVGRNLMDHLQKTGLALAPEPMFPFRGPPSISGIEVFRDDDRRGERGVFRLSLGTDGWARLGSPYTDLWRLTMQQQLFGKALQRALADRVQRQIRLSSSTELLPDPENRVTLSTTRDALGLPRPRIAFHAADYTRKALQRANDAMRLVFAALRATEVQIDDDLNSHSGAGHIMGTCRMGSDPATSVVDAGLRAHDHPNLFVVGSSVFPTGGTANPTLTIAALALRAVPEVERTLEHVP